MPFSADPDALSYPAQGEMAASATHVPGPMPLARVRARITAADASSPINFTWNEVEPAIDGTFVDVDDGLRGDANHNPLRELNGRSPPQYPWVAWAEPRCDFGDKGTLFDFDLGCCGGG